MLKNYLNTTLRHIRRQKGYSLIIIASLVIGLTCFILISIYVRFEFSYDRFHVNAEHTYRILVDTGEVYRGKNQVAITPAPLAAALQAELPDVMKATRIYGGRGVIKHNNEFFAEDRFYYVDEEFLRIFSFALSRGDSHTALNAPFSLLLTPDMAEKYFGSDDPIGKILIYQDREYTVTGITRAPPRNSYFQFDFLASFSSLAIILGEERITRWENWNYHTFVQLRDGTDIARLEPQLTALLKRHRENSTQVLRLQPLTDLHFHNTANFELSTPADVRNTYLFSAIAFFILMLACFNFTTLSTARAAARAKEVGMRKVVGASRKSLINQFMGEALIFSLFSLLLSLVLVKILLPSFAPFVNRLLEFGQLGEAMMLAGLVGLVILVGMVAGIYPALILSSFQPVRILKGEKRLRNSGSGFFRNSLVVTQFVISIALIFCSAAVYKQLHFLMNKDLGINRDYVMGVRTYGQDIAAYKSVLLQKASILETATSSSIPVDVTSASFGCTDGMSDEGGLLVYKFSCDYDFFDFYDLELVQGRSYSRDFSLDASESIILNEAAVRAFAWDDPIGKKFWFDSEEKKTVVGIVKDFHFAPLYLNIEPLAVELFNDTENWLSLRISPRDIPETISFVRETWEEFFPERRFNYTFLDDLLERMYHSEQRLGEIFSVFTAIAILIGCLGLFGLASYTAERKTKEIGIRKVLGASISGIAVLLIQQFVKYVLIANLIAWPIAYYAMSIWLKNFAYKTQLGIWLFVISAAAALAVAVLTVSYQSLKAAFADPVTSLRYE